MSKKTTSSYRIDRRMGENIWGRPKSPVNRREYGPGQHGQRRKGKMSDFGLQLRAKQKLKGYYGDLTEKQFRRIFLEASKLKGDTAENLIGLLERRLDALVYRSKFADTIFSARQFVNHGHVLVNGKKVNIPSYRVRAGDVIEVRAESKKLVLEATQRSDRAVPDYIFADHSSMKTTLLRVPLLVDVPYPVLMEPHLVISFYGEEAPVERVVSAKDDPDLDTSETSLSADVFGQMFRGRNTVVAVDEGQWDEVFEEALKKPTSSSHMSRANAKLRSVAPPADKPQASNSTEKREQ